MRKQVFLVACVAFATTTACEKASSVAPMPVEPPLLERQTPDPLPVLVLEQVPPVVEVPPPEPPPLVVSIEPTVTFDPPEAETVGTIRATKFELDVQGAEGEHEVALQVLTPSGHTYQLLTQKMTGARNGSVRVGFDLPVAGTFIDSSNLSGTWTARVLLDGEERGALTFELEP